MHFEVFAKWMRDRQGVDPAVYLQNWVTSVLAGWVVEFDAVPALSIATQRVQIRPEQLIVGFSRGSDDRSGKSVYFPPAAVRRAWCAMDTAARPRGIMFWPIGLDNGTVNGTGQHVDFAMEFTWPPGTMTMNDAGDINFAVMNIIMNAHKNIKLEKVYASAVSF